MDQGAFTAAMTALGGLCGGLVTFVGTATAAYFAWRKLKHRIKRESDRDSLAHFESIIAHQNQQIERLMRQCERADEHVGETAATLERVRIEHDGCWRALDALYAWVERYAADRPGVPPPPPRPPVPGGLEHQIRTAEQQALQVRELGRGGPDLSPPETQP
jgi:hypothetical protein